MAKKKRKKRKKKGLKPGNLVVIAIVALVTVAVGVVVLLWFQHRPTKAPAPSVKNVRVYFGSLDGTYLTPETRRIARGALTAEVTETVAELLKGPATGLTRTIPEGTKLLEVKVRDNTAFVDLSGELKANHPGGSAGEIQTVYSIVNTVTVNFTAIKNVQILVDGKAKKTLAGHIDISLPLGPDTKIIRTRKTLES